MCIIYYACNIFIQFSKKVKSDDSKELRETHTHIIHLYTSIHFFAVVFSSLVREKKISHSPLTFLLLQLHLSEIVYSRAKESYYDYCQEHYITSSSSQYFKHRTLLHDGTLIFIQSEFFLQFAILL